MNSTQFWFSSAITVLVAIVSAYMTAGLAFHRFRQERVLETKMELYTKLFSCLHGISVECSRYEHYMRRKEVVPPALEGDIRLRFDAGRVYLLEIMNGQDWLLPKECFKELKRMLDKVYEADTHWKIRIREGFTLTKETRARLRVLAREDLGLDVWPWPRIR